MKKTETATNAATIAANAYHSRLINQIIEARALISENTAILKAACIEQGASIESRAALVAYTPAHETVSVKFNEKLFSADYPEIYEAYTGTKTRKQAATVAIKEK